jgi:hypothetical protein
VSHIFQPGDLLKLKQGRHHYAGTTRDRSTGLGFFLIYPEHICLLLRHPEEIMINKHPFTVCTVLVFPEGITVKTASLEIFERF